MSRIARWLLAGGLLLTTLGALAERPEAPPSVPGTTKVTAEEVVELVTTHSDLVVIDSRKPFEYEKGHIQGAHSLVDTDTTPETLAAQVPTKETPVLFYCNGPKCLRSSNAAKKAVDWGYSQVYWFRGGWSEWTDKQLPVTK
jgi:rhodanese-related sulfurtransferase